MYRYIYLYTQHITKFLHSAGATYYWNSKFGDGTLPMLAQSFSCSGTENNLMSCGGTTGYSSCYYGRTAGVRCFSEYNYDTSMCYK